MANQRKEGKSRVSVWLTEKEREALNALVRQGTVRDMSDFIKQSINEEAQRKGLKK
jgi:hypothetical protein